jgi:hypothetical protein
LRDAAHGHQRDAVVARRRRRDDGDGDGRLDLDRDGDGDRCRPPPAPQRARCCRRPMLSSPDAVVAAVDADERDACCRR